MRLVPPERILEAMRLDYGAMREMILGVVPPGMRLWTGFGNWKPKSIPGEKANDAGEYREPPPNESASIPKVGIELTYRPGSSVPRLMIPI